MKHPRCDLLQELCDKEGRDVSSIKRVTSLSLDPDPDTIARTVDQHRADGIDYLYCGWPGEGRSAIERFAARVMTG